MESIFSQVELCMSKIVRRQKVTKYRERAQALSQSLVIPVFHSVSFGGDETGIFGATPFEVLHCLLLGIMKYVLLSLFDYTLISSITNKKGETTTSTSKPFKQSTFEQRLRIASLASKRQSDREMPRSVFNCGVTSLSGIQGQEYVGLSLLTIIALPGLLGDVQKEKAYCSLLWQSVSLYVTLTRDTIPKGHANVTLLKQISQYVGDFIKVVGPQREISSPEVGTKIPRLHGLTHFPRQIVRDGSPNNSNGIYLEKALKKVVKHPAKRTRKTHLDFDDDLVRRFSEFQCIEDYYDDNELDWVLHGQAAQNDRSSSSSFSHATIDCVTVSRPKFHFVKRGTQWNTKVGSKVLSGILHPFANLPETVLRALKLFLNTEVGRVRDIESVSCHYELQMPRKKGTSVEKQIFRCTPNYRKSSWYDWVMVKYTRGESVFSVPSRLYLWLSFTPSNSSVPQYFALTWSMASWTTPSYTYLPCFKRDKLHENAKVVSFEALIESTACCLPSPELESCSELAEKVEDNSNYVVIPPMSEWHIIGWGNSLVEELQSYY